MGKSDNGKWALEFRNMVGMDFNDFTRPAPVTALLAIGKRIASTDFAVRFYYNKQHPDFHTNREALEKAVRRAWAQGAFEHRRQVIELVQRDFSSLIRVEDEAADEKTEA